MATTRTVNTAGRPVVEKLGAPVSSEAAERIELFEVFVTSDEGNCELIKKQVRDAFSSR